MTLHINRDKISAEDRQRADDLRAQARGNEQEKYRSQEESDTDGFVSQWAHGITAAELNLKADLIEAGGVIETDALFDLKGNLIMAREVETQFGYAWGIMDPDNPRGDFLRWFNESKARNPETRRKNNARKGVYVGRVMAKAYVRIIASGTGLSGAASAYPGCVLWRNEETGAPEITEIIDNGQDD